MKKIICRVVTAFAIPALMLSALCGCSSSVQETSDTPQAEASVQENSDTSQPEASVQETSDTSQPEEDSEIYEAISKMTLEQKLSQMMIPALRSDSVNTKTATEIY